MINAALFLKMIIIFVCMLFFLVSVPFSYHELSFVDYILCSILKATSNQVYTLCQWQADYLQVRPIKLYHHIFVALLITHTHTDKVHFWLFLHFVRYYYPCTVAPPAVHIAQLLLFFSCRCGERAKKQRSDLQIQRHSSEDIKVTVWPLLNIIWKITPEQQQD